MSYVTNYYFSKWLAFLAITITPIYQCRVILLNNIFIILLNTIIIMHNYYIYKKALYFGSYAAYVYIFLYFVISEVFIIFPILSSGHHPMCYTTIAFLGMAGSPLVPVLIAVM